MPVNIHKQFSFSASHQLADLPEGHQCSRLHGHNYLIELELEAARRDLTAQGFVRDFGELSDFKTWIDHEIDHRHLNNVIPDSLNPTAEHLAIWIYEKWTERYPELSAVRVSETPKTWAEYRPLAMIHLGANAGKRKSNGGDARGTDPRRKRDIRSYLMPSRVKAVRWAADAVSCALADVTCRAVGAIPRTPGTGKGGPITVSGGLFRPFDRSAGQLQPK